MKNILTLFLVIILVVSCAPPIDDSLDPEVNVVVLLDLGDRISNSNQRKRDITIFEYISSSFLNRIWDYKLIRSNLSIKIADLNSNEFSEPLYEEKLSLNLRTIPDDEYLWGTRTEMLVNYDTIRSEQISDLYNKSLNINNRKGDLWSFFNNDLNNLLSRDSTTNNFIFIISDGYLEQKNYLNNFSYFNNMKNWEYELKKQKAIKPLNKKFVPNTKVLFLELAPKKDFTFEYDMLKLGWEVWLEDIGFGDVRFLKNDDHLNLLQEEIGKLLGSFEAPIPTTPSSSEAFNINGKTRLEFNHGYYEGEVKDGKPHGKGTFYYNEKNRLYRSTKLLFTVTGGWKDGEKEGIFTATDSKNVEYSGNCEVDDCVLITVKANKDTVKVFLTPYDY